ncbi:hypothetical protein EVAR_78225_1 [Eumeta japonica]|uniref:Uncharacterized protein n=1 Tax=Eumeta variegata TaxID=151549 RepID=A0A4C1T5H3_EUMVA|nr:hypothetical protein EVAR_78225_1 [Eumeta japonica]
MFNARFPLHDGAIGRVGILAAIETEIKQDQNEKLNPVRERPKRLPRAEKIRLNRMSATDQKMKTFSNQVRRRPSADGDNQPSQLHNLLHGVPPLRMVLNMVPIYVDDFRNPHAIFPVLAVMFLTERDVHPCYCVYSYPEKNYRVMLGLLLRDTSLERHAGLTGHSLATLGLDHQHRSSNVPFIHFTRRFNTITHRRCFA